MEVAVDVAEAVVAVAAVEAAEGNAEAYQILEHVRKTGQPK